MDITKPGYLSDFENLKNEVIKISNFSKPIYLHTDVLYYSSITVDKKKFEKNKELFKTKEFGDITLNIQKSNLELSLLERVTKYVKILKPELLIVFTKREKSFLERIFLPGKSAELAYTTKVPVSIFSK